MSERVHTLEIWLVLFAVVLVAYTALVGFPSTWRDAVRTVVVPLAFSILATLVSSVLRRL